MLAHSNWVRRTLPGLGIMFVVILIGIGASSCYTTGHPMPRNDEIYEAKDPDTHKVALRIVATKWTDGAYVDSPVVKLRQPDGTIWTVMLYDNDPNWWRVLRIHPEKGAQQIMLDKVYSGPADEIPLRRQWLNLNKAEE